MFYAIIYSEITRERERELPINRTMQAAKELLLALALRECLLDNDSLLLFALLKIVYFFFFAGFSGIVSSASFGAIATL